MENKSNLSQYIDELLLDSPAAGNIPLYPSQAKILSAESDDLNRWCCMEILGIKVGILEFSIAKVLNPAKVADQTGNKLHSGVSIAINSRVITLYHLGELLFPHARVYLRQKTIEWENLLILKDLPVGLGGGRITPWDAKDKKLLHWRSALGGKRPWLLATSVKLNMVLIDLEKLFQALDVNACHENKN